MKPSLLFLGLAAFWVVPIFLIADDAPRLKDDYFKIFRECDKDKDGAIAEAEMPSFKTRLKTPILRGRDVEKLGGTLIVPEEDAKPAKLLILLKALVTELKVDADDDTVVTEAEFNDYVDRILTRREELINQARVAPVVEDAPMDPAFRPGAGDFGPARGERDRDDDLDEERRRLRERERELEEREREEEERRARQRGFNDPRPPIPPQNNGPPPGPNVGPKPKDRPTRVIAEPEREGRKYMKASTNERSGPSRPEPRREPKAEPKRESRPEPKRESKSDPKKESKKESSKSKSK